MKKLILATLLASAIALPAKADVGAVLKQDLACLASTTSDVFSGDFSTTVWPVWFQRLFNVKSLQAGQVSPCMPKAP